MAGPGISGGSTKAKTLLFIGLLLLHCLKPTIQENPDFPRTWEWELKDTLTGELRAKSTERTLTAPPTFKLDLCQLWPTLGSYESSGTGGLPPGGEYGHRAEGGVHLTHWNGCGYLPFEKSIRGAEYYACPADGGSSCQGESQYHCGSWGCETIAPWVDSDPFISLKIESNNSCEARGYCNPVTITLHSWDPFSLTGQWDTGRTWGIRKYQQGRDPGTKFTIQRVKIVPPGQPVGPDREIFMDPPKAKPTPSREGVTSGPTVSNDRNSSPLTPAVMMLPSPILSMLETMYSFVNATNPNLTNDCWFCLNPQPPYYVGISANSTLGEGELQIRKINYTRAEKECSWREPKPVITLGNIRKRGLCLKSSTYPLQSSPFQQYCETTLEIKPEKNEHALFKSPPTTWFACTVGLTPCINLEYFKDQEELCILTHVIPQVYLYDGTSGREHMFTTPPKKVKRSAPILVPLPVGTGIAGSTALGPAPLVIGDKNLRLLSEQTDQNLGHLESSISQVDSLAEVVLQNRQGLDLPFMKQGGLCMALGKTCCLYANHSGVIQNSLALVRKRLEERKLQRQAANNWPPWLTILLSVIAGALILSLSFIIINALLRHIKFC